MSTYGTPVKTARMTATRDYFANGILELTTTADDVLVTFGLSADGGTIAGDTWTLVLDESAVLASAGGRIAKARLKSSAGTVGISNIPVAAPHQVSRTYVADEYVIADTNKLYKCTTGGTTASSGGPTGTGNAITDGSVVWQYVGPAGSERVALTNTDVVTGQAITLSSATVQHEA